MFFLAENADYLGHIIRPAGLEIADTTTLTINEQMGPTNETELWFLLWLRNAFHRLLPNFSCLAAQLNRTVCKNEPAQFQTLSAPEKASVE